VRALDDVRHGLTPAQRRAVCAYLDGLAVVLEGNAD
jgi:DNA gyrase/topoisomerase IV subunit A